MNIKEDEIMEIANKYLTYLDDDFNAMPGIIKDDIIYFVREIIEIFSPNIKIDTE